MSMPSKAFCSSSSFSAKSYSDASASIAKFNALSVNPAIFSLSCFVASSPLAMMVSMSSSVIVLPCAPSKILSAPYRTMDKSSSLFRFFWFSCSRPCWITSASSASFLYAFSITFSSTELSVQKRNTETSFFWPMRCARSIACKSICGFQSLS